MKSTSDTRVSPTTWHNMKQSLEGGRGESVTRATRGDSIATHVSKRLSPLKERDAPRGREQRSSCSTSLSKKCRSIPCIASALGSSVSNLKDRPAVTNGKHGRKVLSLQTAPLTPSIPSERLENYNQHHPRSKEPQVSPLLQSGNDSDNNNNSSRISSSKCCSTLDTANSTRGLAPSGVDGGGNWIEEGHMDDSRLFGCVITDALLKEWTGCDNISLLSTAELRLNTKELSGVDTLSARMPHLLSLKLTNSYVPHIRILGRNFNNLKRLWLGSSHMETLRGIGACCPLLEELYLSFNYVHDITPLLDLSETLEVVDLEGNNIRDYSSLVHCLPLLRKVKYLSLQGNPVTMERFSSMSVALHKEEEGSNNSNGHNNKEENQVTVKSFRDLVMSLMPNLMYLDDIPMKPDAKSKTRQQKSSNSGNPQAKNQASMHVDPLKVDISEEYMFLQQCIRECGFDELEEAVVEATRSVYSRPQTSSGETRQRCSFSASSHGSSRPFSSSLTADRLGHTSSCVSSFVGRRPLCPGQRTPSPPPTSSLTTGNALTGGAFRLRRRVPPVQPSLLSTTTATACVGSFNSSTNPSGTTASSTGSVGYSHPLGGSNVLTSSASAISTAKTGENEKDESLREESSDVSPNSHLHLEDSIDAPLFEDDDDEWEVYKKKLLRSKENEGISMQRWSKYMSSENAMSSHEGYESRGLSAFSHCTSTGTTSVGGGPIASQESLREQLKLEAVETGACCGLSHDEKMHEIHVDDVEDNAWRKELMRSVARSRARTARSMLEKETLQLGGEPSTLAGDDLKPLSLVKGE